MGDEREPCLLLRAFILAALSALHPHLLNGRRVLLLYIVYSLDVLDKSAIWLSEGCPAARLAPRIVGCLRKVKGLGGTPTESLHGDNINIMRRSRLHYRRTWNQFFRGKTASRSWWEVHGGRLRGAAACDTAPIEQHA